MGQNNKRNIYVDVIRGIAMLMVIMDHTMTGCTLESQNSFLFNVIWSLQMPLFILISGYVTKYSRGCYDVHSLGKFVWRRSLAYLLPWVVWTFVIRGVIFGHSHFTEPLWVVYNMDSGYWFLFTIWTISMCFGLAEYVSKRFAHNVQREFVVTTVVFGILGGVLLFVGMFMGLKFLGIKLTVYYMSFYWLGYLYGSFGDKIDSVKYGTVFTNVVITISAFVWIYFMRNVNLFEMSDNGISVLLRMICSITGCVTICGLCKGLFVFVESVDNQTVMIGGGLAWSGVHSLELYLGQYLMLNMLQMVERPLFLSIPGMTITLANFVLTMTLLIMVIKLTNQNKYLRYILYGKK